MIIVSTCVLVIVVVMSMKKQENIPEEACQGRSSTSRKRSITSIMTLGTFGTHILPPLEKK